MREGRAARGAFDFDLVRGEAKEDSLASVLLRSKVEVKFDNYCVGREGRPRTGNIALEWKTLGLDGEKRPSGINPASTQADWLAVEFADDRWLLLPMSEAQEMARRAGKERRSKWGGDDDRFLNALVPYPWFFDEE